VVQETHRLSSFLFYLISLLIDYKLRTQIPHFFDEFQNRPAQEPTPSPSPSPDDMANQFNNIALTTNDNASIQKDVIMTRSVVAKASIDAKISPEERISELEKRKANTYNIWENLR
jgi:hypothetical protein